ncbi:MAG: flagellar biosynthesis anti-sigma factor FlgM [Defluviitaleaceae bacterium]|nr:flagellar biosynthesis anti-sigma factor FlgM [Defluviitaleaceae bacterium]
MKINNIYATQAAYLANNKTRRPNAAASNVHDNFSISGQAEDYQIARRAISRLPDVRESRVDELKNLIESGQYTVNASAIANKILQNFDNRWS